MKRFNFFKQILYIHFQLVEEIGGWQEGTRPYTLAEFTPRVPEGGNFGNWHTRSQENH